METVRQVIGEGLLEPLGTLVYSQQGTLISEKSYIPTQLA